MLATSHLIVSITPYCIACVDTQGECLTFPVPGMTNIWSRRDAS